MKNNKKHTMKNNKKHTKKNNKKHTKKNTKKNKKYKIRNMKGGSKNFCNIISKYNNEINKQINYNGIININNSCYMNSVIQMLWTIPEIRYQILNYVEDTTLNPTSAIQNILNTQKKIVEYLKNIFDFFNDTNNDIYINDNNLKILRNLFTIDYEQHDAEEFFSNIITGKFILEKINGILIFPIIDLNCKFIETSKLICDFPIPGHIRSPDANNDSYMLQLPIDEINNKKIKDYINKYCSVERMPTETIDVNGKKIIEENNISECLNNTGDVEDLDMKKNKGPGTKQLFLSDFSNNLIIQIKRFDTKVPIPFTGAKNDSIVIPDKELEINNTKFKLKGCVVHLGNNGAGHYVYVIFGDNGEPIKEISDSQVLDINNLYTNYLRNGYIYYYRKI